MATIGEIANEAKAILEDIRTNTLGTRNAVNHLDNTTQAGFTNLAAGMAVLIQLGQQANALSAENVEQNQTIICWLDNIAHVLCDMKRDLDASLAEQRRISSRLNHIDAILDLVHAREAVELAARDKLQAEIEACCPPDRPDPTPCFAECRTPDIRPYRPVPVDWNPIDFDRPAEPR